MFKRMTALVCAGVLALTLSACGGNTVKRPPDLAVETSSAVGGETEIVRKAPDSSKYEDDLTGLMSYMKDGKAIALDEGVKFDNGAVVVAEDVTSFTQMSFKEIGAENGYRCQFVYNGSTVQAEFYAFDPENLDTKGKECIGSVREKGFFVILGNEVKAILHPSKKYLMIYTDAKAEKDGEASDNAAQKRWAEELFLGFRK